MRSMSLITVAFVLMLGTRAAAQRDEPDVSREPQDTPPVADPIGIKLGGVLGLPLGGASERFDPGGGFAVGLSFLPRAVVGVQLEYLYSFHGLQNDVFDIDGIDGNHTLQYGDLNLVVRAVRSGPFELYLIGGPGIYHRAVEVSRIESFGVGTYCDPLLFICSSAAVPTSQVLGSETSIDFGVNGGVGMSLSIAPPLRLFIEARYHYIWGPSFLGPGGRTFDSDAEYAPVVLGLAF